MKSRSRELLDRAMAATVAAIEIYNKPDFPYRSETFCILAINGWELLLKAKWLSENNNKLRSLYIMEPRKKKDGTKSKRLRVKKTRSGNPHTHGLDYLGKKLVESKLLDRTAMKNIESLLDLRDSCVHFYHQSDKELALLLQEIGAASLKNFVLAVKEWFARDLSEYNFYLMPLSFIGMPQRSNAVILNREEKNFLRFMHELVAGPEDNDSQYAVTVNVDVKYTRSKAKDALEYRLTRDMRAPEIRQTEEQILEKYPWDYALLTEKCRKRYSDFTTNAKYHGIRMPLYRDERYCKTRFLDPSNPKSPSKRFFNPDILQVLDLHYLKM